MTPKAYTKILRLISNHTDKTDQDIKWDSLLIYMSGMCFGLVFFLFMQQKMPSIVLNSNPHQIVSWVTVHGYSKQQEIINYFLALTIPPLVGLLFYYSGALLSGLPAGSSKTHMRIFALSSLIWPGTFLLVAWFIFLPGKMLLLLLFLQAFIVLLALILKRNPYWNRNIIKLFSLLQENVKKCDYDKSDLSKKPLHQASKNGNLFNCIKYIFYLGIIPIFLYWIMLDLNINKNIDMFHEGECLAPLNALLKDKAPYKDIYLQHGFFQNALIPLAGSYIFQPSVEGVRLMQHILNPLVCVAMYFLCLILFRSGALTAVLVSIVATSSRLWMIERQTFAFISLILLVLSCQFWWKRKNADKTCFTELLLLGSSGFFALMAFWHSVEIGIYTLATAVLFLFIMAFSLESVKKTWRSLFIAYFCGTVIGFWSIGVYLLKCGALEHMFCNVYEQCVYQSTTWGRPFPDIIDGLVRLAHSESLLSGIKGLIYSSSFYFNMPIILFVIAISFLVYQKLISKKNMTYDLSIIILFILAGVFFFRSALGRCGNTHLLYGCTMFWILGIILFEYAIFSILHFVYPLLQCSKRKKRAFVITCNLSVPIVLFLFVFVFSGSNRKLIFSKICFWTSIRSIENSKNEKSSKLARVGNVVLPPEQENNLKKVVNFIRNNTKKDDPLFDFSSQGAYYFLTDRANPTRFHQTAYACTPSMQQEVCRKLELNPPPFVIYSNGGFFDRIDGVPSSKRYPIIEHYLKKNYKLAKKIGATLILERIDDKGSMKQRNSNQI
jgi:hypothetical protein